ncbi:major facilitator superfamily domain-containing protein [Truncatella angustata]|uniref:Major facilitator superfamily domain-containing protein n=1 Tax=Truncatella angustata TaxID=152316 RepID=A0A9P8RE35_9PEZI|nr:major facilitator superfamily domain-containing protein [Truncatella angustata]KAH6638575.1 major facilitator superfamily domain-containing protein [Truncatella angustata]
MLHQEGDITLSLDQPPDTEVTKPQRSITGLRWALVCMAVFSCNLLYGLDNTIVADIQAPIINSLGNVNKLGWLGIGFPLGAIAAILPLGKAYAAFDVKWLYFWSLALFAAASAICGAAPQMNALIIGRVWAGAGGAGMYLGNINMLQRLTIPQERSAYMAAAILVYGTGVILGPVVGGSLADSSSSGWRWAFYLNLFIFAVMAPIYVFLLPSMQPRPALTLTQKLRSLDWLGMILSTAIYIILAMIFTFGGSVWNWADGRAITLYVVVIVIGTAFAMTQYFGVLTTKENRLFPGQFLRERTLVLMLVCCTALSGALYVVIYYLSLFYSLIRNEDGVKTAVRLLPFVIFYVFGVMLNGILMVRWGYYMPWFLLSGILTTAGGALLYTSRTDTADANIYGYSTLVGMGQMSFQAAYSVVPNKVSPREMADVIQFINVGQQGSILVALAICNTIFQNVAFNRLLSILAPAGYSVEDVTAAISGARSLVLQSAPPEIRSAALEVLVSAIDNAYILIVVSGAILILCSALMKQEKITMQLVAGG